MSVYTEIESLKSQLSRMYVQDILLNIKLKSIVVGNNGKEIADNADHSKKTKLLAPQKQWCYLVGLLMSTDEKNAKNQSDDCLDKLELKIDKITKTYFFDFLGVKSFDELKEVNDEDLRKAYVCSMAFDAYFFESPLRSTEQTKKLIYSLYGKYENEFERITGVSFDSLFTFYNYIAKKDNQSWNDFFNAIADHHKYQKEKIGSLQVLNPDLSTSDAIKILDRNGDVAKTLELKAKKAISLLKNVSIITTREINAAFPNNSDRLINLFCLSRQKRPYMFFDEPNPFLEKPLCYTDENEIFILGEHYLMNAIFSLISSTLENPSLDKYEKIMKNKTENTEVLFKECFLKMFGKNCTIHSHVCEKKKSDEHDLLIEVADHLIIAEVKATRFKPPFRDREKGFQRIKRDFENNGIGRAYAQALKLKKIIETNNTCTLYENMSDPLTVKRPNKDIYICVLTLEQYGGLSINLDGLLDKDEKDPYPWVCDWADFDTINEFCEYRHEKYTKFLDYLAFRIERHADIVSSDEIDVMEAFYLNSKTRKIDNNKKIFIEPSHNNYVDKIFYEKHGLPYEYRGTVLSSYSEEDAAYRFNSFFK